MCAIIISSNVFVLLAPHWMIAEYFLLFLKVIYFRQIFVIISYAHSSVFLFWLFMTGSRQIRKPGTGFFHSFNCFSHVNKLFNFLM